MTRPRPGFARPLAALPAALTACMLAVTMSPSPATASPAVPEAPAASAARAADPVFRVATFNVLGASHTVRGRKARLGTGVRRMGRTVRILDRRSIGLVGFQEMQRPQVQEFQRLRSTTWGLYPGTSLRAADGENSIGWRRDQWRLVKADTVSIPYFDGRIRQMPLLLMQHIASGRRVYLLNVHNPATNRQVGNQDRWRRAALAIEIQLVNRLRLTTHLPVLFVGDFNDRELAFCPLGRGTSLRAANGGTVSSTACSLPRPAPVDWIFGTIGVGFSSYTRLDNAYVRRTTDHPVVYADVRLAAPSAIIAP